MKTYKATNGVTSYFKNFADLVTAEAYFLPIFGSDFTVLLAPEDEQIPDRVITLQDRMQKGYEIYLEYLKDNDILASNMGQPMPVSIAENVAIQMSTIKLLLESGSLVQVKEKLLSLTTDAILTQQRIDKYILMIDNFFI